MRATSDSEIQQALASNRSRGRDTLCFLLELHHSQYWQSVGLLAKAWAFHVAMTTAVVGFVYSKDIELSPSTRLPFTIGAVLMSLIAVVGFGAWIWALHRLVGLLEDLTRQVSQHIPIGSPINDHYKVWRKLLRLLGFNVVAIAVIILMGVALVYFDLGPRP